MDRSDEFQRERAALVEEHGRLGRERDLLRCNVEDKTAQLEIEQERNCSLVNSLEQQVAELTASRHQVMGLERVVFEVHAFLGGNPLLSGPPQVHPAASADTTRWV